MKEKSCGAILYRKHKGIIEYLLIKSLANGHWGFPKGHIEEDETESQTALREIKEEVGLDVELNTTFREEIHYTVNENINKTVVFFIAEVINPEIKLQAIEISDFIWASFDACLDLIIHDSNKDVLKKAKDFLNKN